MPSVTTESTYEVVEAVSDAFHAQGDVSAEISTEDHSFTCTATHHFEVDTEPEEDTLVALSLPKDGAVLRARSTYFLAKDPLKYELLFRYVPDSGTVDVTGRPVDVTARNLFDQTPLHEPAFLHTGREPADGPPKITDHPGELI